jgi:hypothetical protein
MTGKQALHTVRSIQNVEHLFYLEFINSKGMMNSDEKQAWDRLRAIMDTFSIPNIR